jgi:hypothetical protein
MDGGRTVTAYIRRQLQREPGFATHTIPLIDKPGQSIALGQSAEVWVKY